MDLKHVQILVYIFFISRNYARRTLKQHISLFHTLTQNSFSFRYTIVFFKNMNINIYKFNKIVFILCMIKGAQVQL